MLHGHLECARLLLQHGARVDLLAHHGWTPLHMACMRGHATCAELLIENKSSLSITDEAGSTCLALAAASGHAAVLQLLLDRGAPADTVDQSGRTVLHCAALSGSWEAVAMLLRVGKRFATAVDAHGATPLHLCAHVAPTPACARGLAAAGPAALAVSDAQGRSPAQCSSDTAIAAVFADISDLWDASNETVHALAARGQDKALTTLPDSALTQVDAQGRTALHVAALFGQSAAVQVLLQRGLDRHAQDSAGLDAVAIAKDNGYDKIATLIAKWGEALTEDEASDEAPEPLRPVCLADLHPLPSGSDIDLDALVEYRAQLHQALEQAGGEVPAPPDYSDADHRFAAEEAWVLAELVRERAKQLAVLQRLHEIARRDLSADELARVEAAVAE